MLLITDGILETHSPEGEMFGKERFKEVVRENARLVAEGILQGSLRSGDRISGGSSPKG